MLQKFNLLLLLVISFLFKQCFTAIMWNLEKEDHTYFIQEEYKRNRDANYYRGMLFTYSEAQRYEFCADSFSVHLYMASPRDSEGKFSIQEYITDKVPKEDKDSEDKDSKDIKKSEDEESAKDKVQFPLSVRLTGLLADASGVHTEPGIFFPCVGQNFEATKRIPDYDGVYYLSYALSGTFYANIRYFEASQLELMVPIFYVGLSPAHVPLTRRQLEEQYMKSRQRIDSLRDESSEYIQQIEKHDNLSELSVGERYVLCDSILSTSVFREEGWEFALGWTESIIPNNMQYQEKLLSFDTEAYANKEWKADCIICRAFKNGDVHPHGDHTDLWLTRSYNYDDSVYVLKEEDGGVVFSKYFTDIPLFKNLGKIRVDKLFTNYGNEYILLEDL